MPRAEKMLRFVDILSERVGKFFSWALVLIIIIVVFDIFARRVFASPTEWGFEVTYMLWGAYFVMVLAWAEKDKVNINIDIFYNRFSPRLKAGVDTVLYLTVTITWIVLMVIGGISFAHDSWALMERTQTPFAAPLYPLKTLLPLGFALLGLQALVRLIRSLMILLSMNPKKVTVKYGN